MLENVVDKRKEYADKLRELADWLEGQAYQPSGVFVSLFMRDNWAGINVMSKTENGFNVLLAGGHFLEMATGLVHSSMKKPADSPLNG